jgi:hypothetical protein
MCGNAVGVVFRLGQMKFRRRLPPSQVERSEEDQQRTSLDYFHCYYFLLAYERDDCANSFFHPTKVGLRGVWLKRIVLDKVD